MGFAGRKRMTKCYVVFILTVCLRLCGSNGEDTGFKIFRGEQDIFTNMKCSGKDKSKCVSDQCESYGAECVGEDNCEYCRCSNGNNTLMKGQCIPDEDIVTQSGRLYITNLPTCDKLQSHSLIYMIRLSYIRLSSWCACK